MAKIITEQDIINASSYIPIDKKGFFAREYAKDCVSMVNVVVEGADQNYPLPSRWQENPKNKSLYGMMVLLDEYLHLIDHKGEVDITFTSSEYDEWAVLSPLNQLDRLKASKNAEVRNKVYDILDDYRDFYRMLGTEIASLLASKNDILARFVEYFQASVTPDLLSGVLTQLSDVTKEIDEYNKKPKEWASDNATEGE